MKHLFAIFACCVLVFQANGQLFGGAPGSSGQTCNYQFSVPNTKGACSVTSSTLDSKVDQIRQDLDKTRLQYLSQNSIVQGTLVKVQADTTSFNSKVTDLTNELQKLKQLITSGSSGSSQATNQMAVQTKDLLTKAVLDINDKIFNLTYQFQKSAVEESKVNTAIQSQINGQAVKVSQIEQQLINMDKDLSNLSKNGGNAGANPLSGGASSAQVTQLTTQFKQLQKDYQALDQSQQTQFNGINTKVNSLQGQLNNQTQDIDTLRMVTQDSIRRLSNAETDVKDASQDLNKLSQRVTPKVNSLTTEVNTIESNITRIEKELQQIGSQLLQGQVTTFSDHATLTKLQTQARNLAAQVSTLNNQTASQSGELVKLNSELNNLMLSGPVNGTGSGNNAAIATAVKNFQSKTELALNQTKTSVTQLQTTVLGLLTQVTTLAKKVG